VPAPPKPSRHSRTYHSTTHPHPPGPFSPTESAILAAAYAHVPEHGFTTTSLALGARAAGYLDISTNLLPGGVHSLVRWHLHVQREGLKAQRAAIAGFEGMDLRAKVEALTWARLMGNKEVVGRLQEALAILAFPTAVPLAANELKMIPDEILYLAGHEAADLTWYTERGSLAAVYAATELFMTNDTSPDFIETQRFLRRRLDEVGWLKNAAGSVVEWLGFTASAGVNLLRSKGVPI